MFQRSTYMGVFPEFSPPVASNSLWLRRSPRALSFLPLARLGLGSASGWLRRFPPVPHLLESYQCAQLVELSALTRQIVEAEDRRQRAGCIEQETDTSVGPELMLLWGHVKLQALALFHCTRTGRRQQSTPWHLARCPVVAL